MPFAKIALGVYSFDRFDALWNAGAPSKEKKVRMGINRKSLFLFIME
jgi:hypothetical protein